MIAITHRSVDELTKVIEELEQLTSKPTMTSRDEKRHAFLLAKVSLLKQGINPSELRRYEQDKLLKEAGLARLPDAPRHGRLDEESETEWRKFALGREVRGTHVPDDREVRANLAGTESIAYTQGAKGGFFVRPGMHGFAFESMKQYDELFEDWASNVVETADGGGTQFPAFDDVSVSSVQVTEASQSAETDINNFGTVQLQAWTFRSQPAFVSLELLQDSNFPIAAILERVFALRHARGLGAALVNGSGVSQPTGLITGALAAGAAVVVASGSSANTGGAETGTTSIGTQDLAALVKALNPAYRRGAVFAMNDGTYQYLLQLLNKMGEPVWPALELRRETAAGDRPNIWGWPIAICPSFPTLGAHNNSVVFYNPFYFVQRRVPSSMYIRRYWEKPNLVENGLVAFESWLRADSGLVAPNSGFVAASILQNHS